MLTKAKKSKKSKKSTTKNRSFKVSPLIPVIAMVEVLVLIAVSTYAWFYVQASKVIGSGTISVAADSGLDIDFQYSNVDDYINIWNYVDSKDFTFEPATSLDGRTIYFPTSGTFDNDTTATTVFRDGTVNDINTKYLSIDFELTNTSEYDQYVYLNNKSYFHVQDVNSSAYEESRALRLAFYQNDGNSGNVGSSLLQSKGSSDGGVISTPVSSDSYTIYFDNSTLEWGTPTAYFYDSDGGSNPDYHTAWPGIKMDRVSGQTYSVTIENPGTGGTNVKYDKLIISNNGNNQLTTRNLTTGTKGHKFNGSGDQGVYSEHTIYFAKPYSWGDVYCHTWHSTGSSTHSYTTYPGDQMTYVGSGIYSYSFDSANTGGFLFDNGGEGTDNQTLDISISSLGGNVNNYLFYTQSNGFDHKTDGKYEVAYTSYASLSYRTIYLFNTFSWEKPYAMVSYSTGTSVTTCDIAMTSLSGNVYYCTVPSTIYSQVYFHAKEQINDNYRTKQAEVVDQQVYRPNQSTATEGDHSYRDFDIFMYDRYIKSTGYPVISPGVSVGFQRPYSPVITIDAYSGEATEIIPAYSNSIDNYILGSGTPLFTLKSGHMASLSMIMWLEGTDEACTGAAYASKQIDLRLEFSTEYYPNGEEQEPVIVNPGDSNAYIYNFYDRTREIWTSDRQSTESGVTVAPVMQLYDNTAKRGYLMSPSKYASYDGKQKVSCWTVKAPQSIALKGHDIIFRRVNPYNEDEVWNYWHAGPVAGSGSYSENDLSIYDIAKSTTSTTNDTINFTAFADGSPTETNLITAKYNTDNNKDVTYLDDSTLASLRTEYSTYLSSANVPEQSCGGLWGNHSVRTVTLLDGLSGQPLKNDSGIITVNYTYDYKVGNNTIRSATIEYKASGPNYNSLYYIIMPSVAYTNSLHCTFKQYKHFDSGYAINSELNNHISFEDTYGDNKQITGEYFELSKKTNGDDFSFWGSDMLVVQTSWETENYYLTGSDKDCLMQVHFYKNDTSSNTGSHTDGDWYSFLYYNPSFKSNDGTGFVTVVPNDKRYYKYAVEVCKYNGSSLKHMTDLQTLTYTTLTVKDSNADTYSMTVNHLNNQNIVKLDKIEAYIYFQTSYYAYQNDPKIYNFSSRDNGGNAWAWSSNPTMEPVGAVPNTSYYMYRYKLRISSYEKVIFQIPQQNNQTNEVSVSASSVVNGSIFQCDSYNNGKPWAWNINTTKTDDRNDTPVTKYTESAWPHFTAQSS